MADRRGLEQIEGVIEGVGGLEIVEIGLGQRAGGGGGIGVGIEQQFAQALEGDDPDQFAVGVGDVEIVVWGGAQRLADLRGQGVLVDRFVAIAH